MVDQEGADQHDQPAGGEQQPQRPFERRPAEVPDHAGNGAPGREQQDQH